MKCRFYLLFFNLLLNLIAPYSLRAPAPTSDVTGVALTTPLTVDQQLRLGLDTRDARLTNARLFADRALSGSEVVTTADLPTYASSVYARHQAALKAKQDEIDQNVRDLAEKTTTITDLQDDVSDEKDETEINSGLIGGLGMGGLALAGAGTAYGVHRRNNKATLTNVERKLAHARKLTIEMAKTPRKQPKLARAVAAFGDQQHQTTLAAIEAAKTQEIPNQEVLLADIEHRSAQSHAGISGALQGAKQKVRRQQRSSKATRTSP